MSEKEKCANNAMVYGLPDSSFSSTQWRINNEKLCLEKFFGQLDNIIPASNFNLINLGIVA